MPDPEGLPLVDHRIYTIRLRKMPEFLDVFSRLAMPILMETLGHPLGMYVSHVGPLNQFVHLWAYKDLADYERRCQARDTHPDFAKYLAASDRLVWGVRRPPRIRRRRTVGLARGRHWHRLADGGGRPLGAPVLGSHRHDDHRGLRPVRGGPGILPVPGLRSRLRPGDHAGPHPLVPVVRRHQGCVRGERSATSDVTADRPRR